MYCSGTYIGSSIDNRDALLQESEVLRIKNEAKLLIDQGRPFFLFPELYERHRDMNLNLDANPAIEGNCEELTIRLEGKNTYIDKVNLDILIAEPF